MYTTITSTADKDDLVSRLFSWPMDQYEDVLLEGGVMLRSDSSFSFSGHYSYSPYNTCLPFTFSLSSFFFRTLYNPRIHCLVVIHDSTWLYLHVFWLTLTPVSIISTHMYSLTHPVICVYIYWFEAKGNLSFELVYLPLSPDNPLAVSADDRQILCEGD